MTAKQNILSLTLVLLIGLFLVPVVNAQTNVSSVKSIEINSTQIITSVACNACVNGTPTGKVDTNGCKVYSCPSQSCPQYSPPPPGWCSDGTIVPQPKDENGCARPAKCVYPDNVQCSSDSDCMELVCPNGGFVHEKCNNGRCALTSKCLIQSCPVGCTCSGDVTTCPVEGIKPIKAKISSLESGATSVSIEKLPNGLSIQSGEVATVTTGGLVSEGNKLFLKTSIGNKEIKILPEEASSKATAVTEVSTIELKEESQQPIYSVNGTKQVKLLFVIPVLMQIETKVSAETGNVISVNKPWWSFLAR